MSAPIEVPLVGGPADGRIVRFAADLPRYIAVPVPDAVRVPVFGSECGPIWPTFGQVRYTVTMERYPPGPEGPRFFAYCREGA